MLSYKVLSHSIILFYNLICPPTCSDPHSILSPTKITLRCGCRLLPGNLFPPTGLSAPWCNRKYSHSGRTLNDLSCPLLSNFTSCKRNRFRQVVFHKSAEDRPLMFFRLFRHRASRDRQLLVTLRLILIDVAPKAKITAYFIDMWTNQALSKTQIRPAFAGC